MVKCIITGSSGFIGSYLTEFLLKQGWVVYSLERGIHKHPGNLPGDFYSISCNILDRDLVAESISKVKPDFVFHLAAQSLPKISWEKPEETFRVNVIGTLYLLDAIRMAGISPVIEIFCSSGEYAISRDGKPITEDHPLEPSSPYALSKVTQDLLSALYWNSYQMKIIRVRPFFIIGPRKVGDVCSDFARGVVAIERGLANKLAVGNLEIIRDFLDIRDAVTAFYLVANRGTPGDVYNICSGVGHKVGEIIQGLQKYSKSHIDIETDASLIRRLDEPIKVGDSSKLNALGWRPSIHFQESLAHILDFWRIEEKFQMT